MAEIKIDADQAFFWSDPHFGHKAMAERRGFGSQYELMDEFLVSKINDRCPAGSTLFLLGDISFRGAAYTQALLAQIKADLVLVRGNHDKSMSDATLAMFKSVHDLLTVKVKYEENPPGSAEEQRIVCCHFPMLAWDMAHHGAWMLHGHSHGSIRYPWADGLIMDVGVEAHGCLGPMSFADVYRLMLRCEIRTADGHTPPQHGRASQWVSHPVKLRESQKMIQVLENN